MLELRGIYAYRNGRSTRFSSGLLEIYNRLTVLITRVDEEFIRQPTAKTKFLRSSVDRSCLLLRMPPNLQRRCVAATVMLVSQAAGRKQPPPLHPHLQRTKTHLNSPTRTASTVSFCSTHDRLHYWPLLGPCNQPTTALHSSSKISRSPHFPSALAKLRHSDVLDLRGRAACGAGIDHRRRSRGALCCFGVGSETDCCGNADEAKNLLWAG